MCNFKYSSSNQMAVITLQRFCLQWWLTVNHWRKRQESDKQHSTNFSYFCLNRLAYLFWKSWQYKSEYFRIAKLPSRLLLTLNSVSIYSISKLKSWLKLQSGSELTHVADCFDLSFPTIRCTLEMVSTSVSCGLWFLCSWCCWLNQNDN